MDYWQKRLKLKIDGLDARPDDWLDGQIARILRMDADKTWTGSRLLAEKAEGKRIVR